MRAQCRELPVLFVNRCRTDSFSCSCADLLRVFGRKKDRSAKNSAKNKLCPQRTHALPIGQTIKRYGRQVKRKCPKSVPKVINLSCFDAILDSRRCLFPHYRYLEGLCYTQISQ